MPGGEGGPPSHEGELAEDRCPNCGSVLAFEPPRPEGFCASCGIYVEILKPLAREPSPPALVREAVLRATKRDLHDLCRAHGLRVSGNKTDLLTRLLRYMDDHGIDLPPEERGVPVEPAPAGGDAVDDFALLPEVGADATTLEPAATEAEAAEGPQDVPEEGAEPSLIEERRVAEQSVDEFLESIHAEAEAFATPDSRRLRRDRMAFYVGTILAVVGGPGLVLGSVLHDAFRVPWVGDAYETFGPLNMIVAAVGTVLLLVGVAAIILSLRGGVVRPEVVGEA